MTKTLPVHPSCPFLSYSCKGKKKNPMISHFDVLSLVRLRNSAVIMELHKEEKALMNAHSTITCFSFSCHVWKVMQFIFQGAL